MEMQSKTHNQQNRNTATNDTATTQQNKRVNEPKTGITTGEHQQMQQVPGNQLHKANTKTLTRYDEDEDENTKLTNSTEATHKIATTSTGNKQDSASSLINERSA